MLRDPPAGLSKQNVEDEGFVPELSLNEFVIKQMEVFLALDPLNPNIKIKFSFDSSALGNLKSLCRTHGFTDIDEVYYLK